MVDKKYLFRLALNQSRYTLPMARSQYKRLEDQQVQRALQQGDSVVVIFLGSHPTQIVLPFGSDVNPKEDSREKRPDRGELEITANRSARANKEILRRYHFC